MLPRIWVVTLTACFALVSSQATGTRHISHLCSIYVDTQHKVFNMSCLRQRAAPPECHLTVYDLVHYGPTSGAVCTPSSCGTPQASVPHPLPTSWRADYDLASHIANAGSVEHQLGRRHPMALLYFHGGPQCNIVLQYPVVKSVTMPVGNQDAAVEDRASTQGTTQLLAFAGGMHVKVTGGHLVNNTASMGLAVLPGSSLQLVGTKATDNHMRDGVIHAFPSAQLTMVNVTMDRNTAAGCGAAVVLEGPGCQGAISSSEFTNNTAGAAGGAVVVSRSNLTLRHARFVSNAAPKGGALMVSNSTLTVEDSVIENSTAAAIHLPSSHNSPVVSADQTHDPVGTGGALHSENSSVSLFGTNLTSNMAVLEGGAVYANLTRLSIQNGQLLNNTAHRNGGAVYMASFTFFFGNDTPGTPGSHLTLERTDVCGNVAVANGGGLFLEAGVETGIHNCAVKNNTAWGSGGGLCTYLPSDNTTSQLNLTRLRMFDFRLGLLVKGSVFANNSGVDCNMAVGPHYNLSLEPKPEHLPAAILGMGVNWRKRLCGVGEMMHGKSGYCQACQPHTYQLEPECLTGWDDATNRTVVCQCKPASENMHAAGGAVVVAEVFHWHPAGEHGHPVVQEVLNCSTCPHLPANLASVTRCPNPAACKHSVSNATEKHPNNWTAEVSQSLNSKTWAEYGLSLCNVEDGFHGILCGVCRPGFGQTAPFSCSKCFGANHSSTYPYEQLTPPSRVGISWLYVFYWAVLTCWYLFNVWSSMSTKSRRDQAKPTAQPVLRPQHTAAGMHRGKVTEQGSHVNTVMSVQPAQSAAKTVNMDGATCFANDPTAMGGAVNSRSLDVFKALANYVQWIMLIVSLPVSRMPWSPQSGATAKPGGLADAWSFIVSGFNVLFGRVASLDCLLQAWDRWQGFTAHDIASIVLFRAAVSTMVVPLVMFITVVVMQLLWVKVLRRRVLRQLLRQRWLRHHLRLTDMLSISDLEQGFSVTPGSVVTPGGTRAAMDGSASCPAAIVQPKVEDDSPFMRGMLGGAQQSVVQQEVVAALSPELATTLPQRVTCPADFGLPHRVRFARSRRFSYYFLEHVIATALVVFFDVYTTIATAAVALVSCVDAGDAYSKDQVLADNARRWILDVRLTCPPLPPPQNCPSLSEGCHWQPWSIGAAVLSSVLLLLCLGCPVAIAVVLLREAYKGNLKGHLSASAVSADVDKHSLPSRSHRRMEDHITGRLAYRYQDYAADYDALRGPQGLERFRHLDTMASQLRTSVVLVWDSVLDLHRFLLAWVAVCVWLHEVQQLILVAAVLGVYLALVLAVRPWKSTAVWYWQSTSLFVLVGSCLGIAAINADRGNATDPEASTPGVAWFIVGLNAAYVLFTLGFLVRCVWREVRQSDCCCSTLPRVRSFTDT